MNANGPSEDSHMDEVMQAEWQRHNISSISPEVLVAIFGFVPSTHSLPVTLSHVCKLWRDVALGAPDLWANITIREEMSAFMTHFLAMLLRIQHCLTRSASHPLTLDVSIFSYKSSYGERNSEEYCRELHNSYSMCIKTLSAILGPHVWRFTSFKLSSDEFSIIAGVQSSFPQIPMRFLEVWEVSQYDEYGEPEARTMEDKMDILECTALSIPLRPRRLGPETRSMMFPRLRTVSFSGTPLDWSYFAPTNLRSLEIRYLSKLACPDGEVLRQILLANAHSLVTLKLPGAAPRTRAKEPYVLPNLERLDLDYVCAEELIPFAQDVRLPRLKHFAIQNLYPWYGDYQFGDVRTSLFRNFMNNLPLAQLQSVDLNNIRFVPFDPVVYAVDLLPDLSNLVVPALAFEFLCKLTSLKQLTLTNPDKAILNALNHVPVDTRKGEVRLLGIPIPSLDVLRLERLDGGYVELEQMFLETRISRRQFHLPIKRIMFVHPAGGWKSEEARDWICEIFRSIDVLSITRGVEYLETETGLRFSLSH